MTKGATGEPMPSLLPSITTVIKPLGSMRKTLSPLAATYTFPLPSTAMSVGPSNVFPAPSPASSMISVIIPLGSIENILSVKCPDTYTVPNGSTSRPIPVPNRFPAPSRFESSSSLAVPLGSIRTTLKFPRYTLSVSSTARPIAPFPPSLTSPFWRYMTTMDSGAYTIEPHYHVAQLAHNRVRELPGSGNRGGQLLPPSSPDPGWRTADQSHSFLNGRIGFALGATMKSTGNMAVSAAAETARSTRSRDALTGRKRSFAAGEYPSATDGRHRQDLRLNRTPEYGFPICTSTAGSRPAFETTVLQPAERPMIPNRHVNLRTRIRQSRRAGPCYRAPAGDFSFLVFPTERLPHARFRPPSFAWFRRIGSTIRPIDPAVIEIVLVVGAVPAIAFEVRPVHPLRITGTPQERERRNQTPAPLSPDFPGGSCSFADAPPNAFVRSSR